MEINDNKIKIVTEYELALNNSLKPFPKMENGSLVVKKSVINGIAVFGENVGVIDSLGREVVPCIFDSVVPISSDLFIVGKEYTDSYFHSNGDYSFPEQIYGIYSVSKKGLKLPLEFKNINLLNGNEGPYLLIESFKKVSDYSRKLFNVLLSDFTAAQSPVKEENIEKINKFKQ